MKCKYALQKLNCYYQKKEIFEDDSSIEHILPECNEGNVTNIGNLIMLEGNLNTEADKIVVWKILLDANLKENSQSETKIIYCVTK